MDDLKKKLLIVDDEAGIREQFKWSLESDYDLFFAENAAEAVAAVQQQHPDLVILDLALSKDGREDEGLEVFEKIQLHQPRTKVIIITGNEQKEMALKAVQMGAYDFYKKPIDLKEFKIILERAAHLQKLESEVRLISEDNDEHFYNHEIVGQCPQMQDVYDIIERTSQTDATILIHSESGTGKELVARAIHLKSLRKDTPFVVINCGAIPENLLEAELFGHEKGAFTGAHIQRKGKFELADKGTIFLDEIGELSLALQVKLLRFLQERQIERVGGREHIEVDVRIIAASNRILEDEIAAGTFRPDLFYRLSVISIHLPPLRERGEDILRLADHFLHRFKKEYQAKVNGFATETKGILRDYAWPGNVRELENKVRRAVIMARSPLIAPEDLNVEIGRRGAKKPLKTMVEEFEQSCIRDALMRNEGNVSRTAEDLGVNRTTFYDMLHKYKIEQSEYVVRKKQNST